MDTWQTISLISFAIAIVGIPMGVITPLWITPWCRKKLVQLTGKPNFKGRFERVGEAITQLKQNIKAMNFDKPDVILGVSGEDERVGGTIIGAWLASPNVLHRPFRQTFRDQPLINSALANEIQNKGWTKFLLVDDESQSGDTLMKEVNEIKGFVKDRLNKKADVRVAVVVVRSKSWMSHYQECWRDETHYTYTHKDIPDGSVKGTKWHDVGWPWETLIKNIY